MLSHPELRVIPCAIVFQYRTWISPTEYQIFQGRIRSWVSSSLYSSRPRIWHRLTPPTMVCSRIYLLLCPGAAKPYPPILYTRNNDGASLRELSLFQFLEPIGKIVGGDLVVDRGHLAQDGIIDADQGLVRESEGSRDGPPHGPAKNAGLVARHLGRI